MLEQEKPNKNPKIPEITFASELLSEVKATSKRWFIAFIIVLVLWFATIGGFITYLSLPVEETVTVENEDGNANYIGNDLNGGINNGESDNN